MSAVCMQKPASLSPAAFCKTVTSMATLPGMPQDDDDPEPDALPVDPDDGLPPPIVPEDPGRPPVEPPRA